MRAKRSKDDTVVGDAEQPRVGDGDAMGIPAEILEDLRRTGEGLLRVDDPLDAVQRAEESVKGARLSQRARAADKLNFARFHDGIESLKKGAAELSLSEPAARVNDVRNYDKGTCAGPPSWSCTVRMRVLACTLPVLKGGSI